VLPLVILALPLITATRITMTPHSAENSFMMM
jgi:hypothetical protein